MRGVCRPYEEIHKMIENIEYKLCSRCDEWLPLNKEYFYKNKSAPDGFNPYCKECNKNKTKNWRKDNPDKHKKLYLERNSKPKQQDSMRKAAKNQRENGYFKNYQQENKDKFKEYRDYRSLHKVHEISNNEWENCKNYFNYRCAYCGLTIEDHWFKYRGKLINGDFAREHVNHNGSNDLSNCVPSCKNCNSQKWEYYFEDWYSEGNTIYSEERKNKIIKWLEDDYKLFIEKIDS